MTVNSLMFQLSPLVCLHFLCLMLLIVDSSTKTVPLGDLTEVQADCSNGCINSTVEDARATNNSENRSSQPQTLPSDFSNDNASLVSMELTDSFSQQSSKSVPHPNVTIRYNSSVAPQMLSQQLPAGSSSSTPTPSNQHITSAAPSESLPVTPTNTSGVTADVPLIPKADPPSTATTAPPSTTTTSTTALPTTTTTASPSTTTTSTTALPTTTTTAPPSTTMTTTTALPSTTTASPASTTTTTTIAPPSTTTTIPLPTTTNKSTTTKGALHYPTTVKANTAIGITATTGTNMSQSSTRTPTVQPTGAGASNNTSNSHKTFAAATKVPVVEVAGAALTKQLVDTASLLAVLLFGLLFLLVTVAVFVTQAYESYRRKDYTQVDYLINGMYTDSGV